MVGVGQRLQIFIFYIVSMVITLIVSPNSIKLFGIKKIFFINMVQIGSHGSIYFFVVTFFDIRLANFPTTCTIVGSFLFLPDLLRNNSLIVFV
jgi:uncharacterized membrane protein